MTPHGRAAMALLQQLSAKKLPSAEQIMAFRDMERRFPNFGWERAAMLQEQWFRTKGKLPERDPGEEG